MNSDDDIVTMNSDDDIVTMNSDDDIVTMNSDDDIVTMIVTMLVMMSWISCDNLMCWKFMVSHALHMHKVTM